MKTITILLDEKSIRGLAELVRRRKYHSRSDAIRNAIRDLLKEKGVW
ncbi:MAG: ribbon-helix-helix domain-containing protein [Candidatus Freyarchaeota archaeon]